MNVYDEGWFDHHKGGRNCMIDFTDVIAVTIPEGAVGLHETNSKAFVKIGSEPAG